MGEIGPGKVEMSGLSMKETTQNRGPIDSDTRLIRELYEEHTRSMYEPKPEKSRKQPSFLKPENFQRI